ncbi:MAG: diacylglycerol/lipid kinase family protein [Gemmatimonadaceae bacterium]
MSPNSSSFAVRRALLIVNPGARRAARAGVQAVREFAQRGIPCEVIFTTAPGHATELARERASKVDAVFTLGGDGTAMEVITALADQGPPVGILPGGTGNVLVRSLGIPLRVGTAVNALVDGHELRLDLGRLADGRHFAIGLGVGLDEAMIAGASRMMKRHTGVFAYVWSALLASIRLERFRVRLTVDGVLYDRHASSVLIANLGSVLGGLIKFGDNVLHDDGLLQACVYSPQNMRDMVRIFSKMLNGTSHLDRCTFCVSGREFRLETDPPRRAQADGELLEMTPIEITVRPLAGRVLVPRDQRSS